LISGVTGTLIVLITLFSLTVVNHNDPSKTNVYLLQQVAAIFLIGTLFMYLVKDKKQ
jgi:hypothetical protein